MYDIFTYIWLICMVNVGRYTIHGWYGSWFDIGRNNSLGFCSKHLFCSQIQGGFWWFVGKVLSLLHTPCSMSSPPELRIVLWDIWKRKQFILTLRCWRWSMKVAWICCLVWEVWLSTRDSMFSHLLAILVLDLKIEYVDIRKIQPPASSKWPFDRRWRSLRLLKAPSKGHSEEPGPHLLVVFSRTFCWPLEF